MSQDNTDHDPFKYWQQKELTIPRVRPPVSPRPTRSVKPSPSAKESISKRPSLPPPPRPPDPSELFRPVRISSTGGSRDSTLKVASLTRKFEMTSSSTSSGSPTPTSPSPSRRTLPRPVTPNSQEESRDTVPWSAPPTLRPPPRRSSWDRLMSPTRSKPTLSSSFVSHLDGPPLDPVAVSAELQAALKHKREVFEQVPRTLSRSSPVITHPSLSRLPQAPSQQLLRDHSGALSDAIRTEHQQFWTMVERLVSQHATQRGTYMASPVISHSKPRLSRPSRQRSVHGKSPSTVRIAMETTLVNRDTAVILQCKLSDTVGEVIRRGLGMLAHTSTSLSSTSPEGYRLKVCGKDEYLDNDCPLVMLEYVHVCLKMMLHVHVVLLERSLVKQVVTSLVKIVPPTVQLPYTMSRDELNALVDSYFTKSKEFHDELSSPHPVNYQRHSMSVISCVRLLCERMMFIEPFAVSEAVFNLRRACKATSTPEEFTIALEMETIEGGWSCVSSEQLKEMQSAAASDVSTALTVLQTAVREMVQLYCSTVHCEYEPVWVEPSGRSLTKPVHLLTQSLRVKLLALHRIMLEDQHGYNAYQVEVCVFYGGKRLSRKSFSPPAKISQGFFPLVTWNKWITLALPLSKLPREARLCFTLVGLSLPSSGLNYSNNSNKEVLAWVALRLFDADGMLCSGPQLLAMWRDDSPADPTDTCYANVTERRSMVLEIALEEFEYRVESTLPSVPYTPPATPPTVELQTIAEKDRFDQLKDDELAKLWRYRAATPSILSPYARGLPAVLQAMPHHHLLTELAFIKRLLGEWTMTEPIYGLELLDTQYADGSVRNKAVQWVDQLPVDDIIDLLPQLTQSLKHDCYLTSAMTQVLLGNSMTSPRLAHHLYWNLHTLAQSSHYQWRYSQLQQALCVACGEECAMEWAQEVELVQTLEGVALAVKASKDTQRQTTLVHELQRVSCSLPPVFRLPLNPSLQCCDIDIENCSFFNSKTVPLKLSFRNADPFGSNIDVIFKAGDDLRQDMLTLQIIGLMNKLWLKAGLDLKMVTYECLATGPEEGLVEMVQDSSTLRQIQTEHGVTGSFKDKPLSEWLMRHNSSDAAWKQAIENFTHSCAGYCVATYVLGICDRHNDNIMVCKTGHMFHIDFGRILGNAQMFGSIKRDRVPFVLTPDMAYVINAGDKPSARFQKFTDLCCTAYNELRRHSHLLLSIMSLMLSGELPELSSIDDVQYVRDALLPQSSDEEATYIFTKHIEASLSSMATQINFFIHNLAQFKFATPNTSGGLLSFSPSSYSIATDGKVESAVVVAYHKKFYPSKYIVYQIQVTRVDPSLSVTYCFRRYSEFSELHKKLMESFEALPQLPGKTFLPGQSTTRETSERRQNELSWYLKDLLLTDSKISESDVVYTFLHCLLRDEQYMMKMREDELSGEHKAGRVKLDLSYSKEHERLSVMVKHVRELVPRDGSDTLDPYVKLYLLPDPKKSSKQKTKIARKTLNPTYNQMFYYTIKQDRLADHSLQLSVWDASSLLSKECLGCVLIELTNKELSTWFELEPASLIQR